MAINALNTALSGLAANQFRQNVAANNIANVNTDGFQTSTVQTADAAYINDIGQGTQISGTYAPARPGPAAIDTAAPGGLRELSNTDMVAEATNQISAQHAYGANIAMLKTADQANETLIDLKG